MKKLSIYLVLVLAVLSGCKKYEDGPLISLRSKEKRLCQKWELNKMEYNGQSQTINAGMGYFYWDIDKNGSIEQSIDLNGVTESMTAEWEWSEDKESIYIIEPLTKDGRNTLFYTPFKNNSGVNVDLRTEFQIIKLKYDELILEFSEAGDHIRMEFDQK